MNTTQYGSDKCTVANARPYLQGPTSSGKTSLVEYLAERTGHRFMRINNHEHTDLQEYLGSYVTDANGGVPSKVISVQGARVLCDLSNFMRRSYDVFRCTW
jgi:midasin (ATPase involved in ribosome maturation)